MESIRAQYADQASAVRSQMPGKFTELSDLMASFTVDPTVLSAEFAVKPSPSAALATNATVAAALARTQAELFSISSWT